MSNSLNKFKVNELQIMYVGLTKYKPIYRSLLLEGAHLIKIVSTIKIFDQSREYKTFFFFYTDITVSQNYFKTSERKMIEMRSRTNSTW